MLESTPFDNLHASRDNRAMQISESVRAALVPDENPMHPDFTCIYLVGAKGQQSLTIDSGEAIDRYQWFLRGYLAAVEREEIGIATITHHHSDHSGNLKWAKEFLKADISIPANGRALLKGRLPAKVDTLKDGDVIERGTHNELLAKKGAYYDLYMSQFRREETPGEEPAEVEATPIASNGKIGETIPSE